MADGSQSNEPATSQSSSRHESMSRSTPDVRGAEPSSPEEPRANMRSLQSFRFQDSPSNVTSPENTPAEPQPRRNQINRRPSARTLPRRRQGFSVDDASKEIEAQQEEARRSKASGSGAAPYSTLRHRSTVGSSKLPFLNAANEEEDEDAFPVSRKDFEPKRNLSRQNTFDRGGDGANEATGRDDDADERVNGNGDEEDEDEVNDDHDVEDDDADLSDAESFTLKDRQDAINETHPFGIRIWKPALYKKGRSVEKEAEGDIHSTPGRQVSRWLVLFNYAWTLIFGWWLALLAAIGALFCYLLAWAPGCKEYGHVLWGFAKYIFYPFGKYVKLIQEEAYAQEDEGEGRSISEYERWQQGDLEQGRLFFGPIRGLVGRHRREDDSDDDESSSLLGRNPREGDHEDSSRTKQKRRLFGRGQWNLGRVIFFVFFYGLLTPLMFMVSLVCWLMVFTIPMGRVTLILIAHLQRRPLALEFHSDTTHSRANGSAPPASIILCTYRAVGTRYWKYTVDGTNVILINLLGVVAFTIFDYFVLYEALGIRNTLTDPALVFPLALFSIVPLAYFIGQAVASISAQSTMGVGAAINAFFSTIVEVFLYCVALNQGKARLVEGSIIGSIFAGILFLPGLSMCFGAVKRKTQRFNVKSAGVTTTMLLFAVIASFSPTLFYEIYGSHKINCHRCENDMGEPLDRDCRRCFFSQTPALHDPFFTDAVRPYSWFASVMLFFSYIIGLLFTLRTHAATIWNTELDEKKLEKMENAQQSPLAQAPSHHASVDYGTMGSGTAGKQSSTPNATVSRSDIRNSQLYKRILTQSMKQAGLTSSGQVPLIEDAQERSTSASQDGAMDGSIDSLKDSAQQQKQHRPSLQMPGLTDEQNQGFIKYIAEMAATAAAVAARDATQNPRKASSLSKTPAKETSSDRIPQPNHTSTESSAQEAAPQVPPTQSHEQAAGNENSGGGHDAPNWGRLKSYTVLLTATVAYAIIAEILVNTVDSVLSNVDIDEKFLGITLFALVPNTTEFLNAISFAMNGNIALSMEIGSAYALQVCLLQMPALVLFSAVRGQLLPTKHLANYTFSLLFPQWDMVTVILCVFLLSYMYGEGKSNYFKGSILILSYFVVVVGFYLSGMSELDRGKGDTASLHLSGFTKSQMLSLASYSDLGWTEGGKRPEL